MRFVSSLFALVLFVAWHVVTDRYYINYRSNDRFGYRTNALVLPVGAAGFVRGHDLTWRAALGGTER